MMVNLLVVDGRVEGVQRKEGVDEEGTGSNGEGDVYVLGGMGSVCGRVSPTRSTWRMKSSLRNVVWLRG